MLSEREEHILGCYGWDVCNFCNIINSTNMIKLKKHPDKYCNYFCCKKAIKQFCSYCDIVCQSY